MQRTKTETQHFSLKKKLTAAVAMLLVCTLMLVTSTYAWFTLSTAPEVTGITTTVGANGNLEMALANDGTWGNPDTITSAVGDSMDVSGKDVTLSNITWGNLIDLSATSYGLQNITLLPSRLNVTTAGVIGSSPLSTATYGADGRVMALANNTTTGTYRNVGGATGFYDGGNGVRAIGTASSMTAMQLDYRSARSGMQTNAQAALTATRGALTTNGSALANIVVAHGTVADDATEGTYDVTFVQDMLDKLTTANGSFAAIIKNYFGAQLASTLGDDSVAYTAAKATLDSTDADALVTSGLTVSEGNTVTIPTSTKIADFAALYTANKTALGAANEAYAAIGDKAVATWEQTKAVLDPLVNTAGVKVNGYASNELKDNIDALATAVMGDGILVQMPTGSGFFANVAEVCGDYEASITIASLSYGSITLTNLPAKMKTTVAATAGHPSAAISDVMGTLLAAPSGATGADSVISDCYGYALDFFFRTNATESDLLLSTAGMQRIYGNDSTNPETMGQGSYMQFSSTNANFTNENVINLMKAIKIVFADGENHVLAYAALDMDMTGEPGAQTPNYTVDGTDIKANIVLCDATIAEDAGELTLTPREGDDAETITALTKNQATKVTAIVYLDGDMVDNGDVANALTSMTGSMNLQFKSNATLNPMNYTPLKEG